MAQPNTVDLNYYVLGEPPENIIPISIPRDAKIYDLREMIIEKHKNDGNIIQPALFKTNRAEDDLPDQPAPPSDTPLKFHHRVGTHWPAGTQPDETRVHILVKAKGA